MGFFYVFGAADPNHRCRLPESVWPDDTHYYPINDTHRRLIDAYIPSVKNGTTWEKCVRHAVEYANDTLINCPNGWAYDRSVYGYTFTEEANFVCDRESRKSWLATLLQSGGFSLFIIGSFSDRYGRRKITVIVTVLLLIICLISQALMQWVPMSADTRFILLLFDQFASGLTASTFSLIFILLLELTSSAHTSFAGNAALVSFTIGEVIVTLFAYLAKDWQKLKWADTIFVALIVPYLYFMPESPLYLYSKRQYGDLEVLLRRIATGNRRKESDWYPFYQTFIQNHSIISTHENKPTFARRMRQILFHRPTISKLLIIALLGFTTLMLYIKISYGLAVMDISPYLGILIGAVVEAAGYVSGSLLISTRLGRKGSFILMMILTVICVVLIPILIDHDPLVTVFIAQLGKFAISGSIAVSWIFVPELFPTSIRGSANGFFIAFSRIGAIVAPIINTSVKTEYQPYTFYISSGLAIVVILLTLLLPETKNKSMEDSDDYSINRSET